MKQILALFKNAFGIPLFAWLFFFLLWQGVINYYTSDFHSSTLYLPQIIMALNLVGLTMFIAFLGYLFSVAVNVSKGKEKPLYPMGLKNAVKWGGKLLLRLIFINLPIFILLILNHQFVILTQKISIVVLCYIVLIDAPYTLWLIVKSDDMPYIKGFKEFFSKKASLGFACIFWITLSFIISNQIFFQALKLANKYSTSLSLLVAFGFFTFFLIFYLLFFCAQIIGFFAKKAVLKSDLLEKEPQQTSSENKKEKEVIQNSKKHKDQNKK